MRERIRIGDRPIERLEQRVLLAGGDLVELPAVPAVPGEIFEFDIGSYFQDSRQGLWKTDGTAEGTVLLRRFKNANFQERQIAAIGSAIFFLADDGSSGQELWKTDGTGEGTVLVKDINPGGA